jgi:Txe/YoeB family toxin of Txe-Axe toxin-antitoxin module
MIMKSTTSFFAIVLAIICLSFRTDGNAEGFTILGKWVTTDSKGTFIEYGFASNGKYEIVTKDKIQKSDKTMGMNYTFDDTKSPAWIDLEIINKKDPKMSLKILGIIQIIDENSFKMNLGDMKNRPMDFSGSNVAIFSRPKKP